MKAARICFFVVLCLSAPLSLALAAGDQPGRTARAGASGPEGKVPGAEAPVSVPKAGTVIAVDPAGQVYTVDLGDELASRGSILQVYRRLPAKRGTAAYRSSVVWWEVGQLTVQAVGNGLAIASWSAEPSSPVPAELEESGAPGDLVLVGDRVRATGGIAARPAKIRVTFARSDLFESGGTELGEEGTEFLATWLEGLESMEGPIEVEVHAQLEAMGTRSNTGTSAESRKDYPVGPTLDRPTTPSEDLFEETRRGAEVPEAREVLVVGQHAGKAEVWHYVDPIRLARRQGDRIADALAAHLRIDPEEVLVHVVPRRLREKGSNDLDVPGYEALTDQVRILATGISYVQPEAEGDQRRPEVRPRRRPRQPAVEQPRPQREQPRRRRRRLLERPPEVSGRAPVPQPGA
ncbi:MAG: hypothetical protein VX498_06235 [Myxococcota bacterium]|nr:hypothetical protein [Myxococcota bacterium]